MTTPQKKLSVYIASPYSKGDPAINTNFQCQIFDQLMNDGRVLPVAPLWSHFQHTVFPRAYNDWINYDKELLPLYDACIRLEAKHDAIGYKQNASSGADGEVAYFKSVGKPVFYSIDELTEYLDKHYPRPGSATGSAQTTQEQQSGPIKPKGMKN